MPKSILLALTAAAVPAHANGAVNVYTYRQPALINPLFEAFTAKTGIPAKRWDVGDHAACLTGCAEVEAEFARTP